MAKKKQNNYTYYDLNSDKVHNQRAFVYGGQMLCLFTTDFDIREYNKIFQKYTDKEYPIVVDDNGIPQINDKDEPIRNYADAEITYHNQLMNKYRTIEILKIMADFDFADLKLDECCKILDSLGQDVYEKINELIQQILIDKYTFVEQQRDLIARQILAFDIKINSNKKSKPKDSVMIENGIKREYLILSLAKDYGWEMDFIIRVLKSELSEDEEMILSLMLAKHELDCEHEQRIHDKMEKERNSR